MTIVGTRPEIIRLSELIKKLDARCNHTLVHTGQNSAPTLSDVFFEDLNLRDPDEYLGVDIGSIGVVIGQTLQRIEAVLDKYHPDAVMILGDTNSALSALIAERRGIPVYHMEAGNRSFDANVPEELNRRVVDHVSSFNLAYNSYSKANLIKEGIEARRIFITGSPMAEIASGFIESVEKSKVLKERGLDANGYFLVSLHRQENVDSKERLVSCIDSLTAVSKKWSLPVLVSVHPRTRIRLEKLGKLPGEIIFSEPFGLLDYWKLQLNARCVISDSGTISEESAILGFPAVSMRSSIERPESVDVGATILAGIESDSVLRAIDLAMERDVKAIPEGYEVTDFSDRVLRILFSTVHVHKEWRGLRG